MDNEELQENFHSALQLWCDEKGLSTTRVDGAIKEFALQDDFDGKGVRITRWDFDEKLKPTNEQLKKYSVDLSKARGKSQQMEFLKKRQLQLHVLEGTNEVVISVNGELYPLELGLPL